MVYINQLIIIDDFAKIKFSNLDQKNYWGRKNNHKKITNMLTKDFKCQFTEIYYGSLFSMNSLLVNKKIKKNITMIIKDIQGSIHFFFKPFIFKLRIIVRKLLKFILSDNLFNNIINKYRDFHHNITKS